MDRPIAKAGTNCPLWRKDVSKVCHKCEWFKPVKGKHPQSEEVVDSWGCAIAWAPMLAINIAQHTNGVQAATEKLHETVLGVAKAVVLHNQQVRVTHTEAMKRIS